MNEKNYFANGITDFLILSILSTHDSYVYEIAKTIETNSQGLLCISPNTIYTATYKLENEGKISQYSQLVGKRRVRIYYHLEKDGFSYLEELRRNYNQTLLGVQNVMNALLISPKERTPNE